MKKKEEKIDKGDLNIKSIKREKLLILLHKIFKNKNEIETKDLDELIIIKELLIKNKSNYITYRTILILLNFIIKNKEKKNNGRKKI